MAGMADIEGTIWDYLANLQINPVLPISFPNAAFKTPQDNQGRAAAYIEAEFHPNMHDTTGIAFGSPINHRGFILLKLYWPSDEGDIPAMLMADQIAGKFTRGSMAISPQAVVKFEQAPDIAASIEASDYMMTPITVAWRCVDA